MNKPSNYDSVTPTYFGDYEKLQPGGYVCKIIDACEAVSRNKRNMLVLYVDIAEGESSGFFLRQAGESAKSKEWREKWRGIYRQVTDGDSTSMFKGLITSIEESNTGYSFNFDEKTLKGKLVGLIFGEEEYVNNKGNTAVSCKPMFPRSIQAIRDGDYKTPELKRLSGGGSAAPNMQPPKPHNDDFFTDGGNLDDDDLPF